MEDALLLNNEKSSDEITNKKSHLKKHSNKFTCENLLRDEIEIDNSIYKYYYTTIEYLKKIDKKNKYLKRSNNFLPKAKYNFESYLSFDDDEKYRYNEIVFNSIKINKKPNYKYFIDNNNPKKMNEIYYNNINSIDNMNKCFLNEDVYEANSNTDQIKKVNSQEDKINGLISNVNQPPFIPSNLNKNYNLVKVENDLKEKENDIERDKESVSTSAKTSPCISEKMGKEKNFFSLNQLENTNINNKNMKILDKDNYLVEMFGKRGWVCILCNNFNYETRVKCNRCGARKKPKRFVENKIEKEMEIKEVKDNREEKEEKEERENMEIKEMKGKKEKHNKKGDWICSNCKNLNYSFRTVCNRCRIPKVYLFINNPITCQNKTNSDNKNCSSFCISPAFIVFNNMPNIIINNYGNNKGNNNN